jgi:predicted ATP-dependent serine protease
MTLVCGLSRSIGDGVPFVGFLTPKTPIVYLTEQANSIVEALKLAGLDKRNDFLRILQWRKTRAYSWQEIVDAAVEEAHRIDAGHLIVDTVNRFAGLKGDEENNAGAVAAAMNPLLDAAQSHNLAVLSIRHANKEGRARGSTQFDHDVDMLLTLNRVEGNGREIERLLTAVGRHAGTPEKLTVELTDNGYVSRGSGLATQFTRATNGIQSFVSCDPSRPTKFLIWSIT